MSTKLGTKHPWVKGILLCFKKWPHPFPRGDNYEIANIHWRNLKIFFSRTNEPISTKLGAMHPLVKRYQVWSNEGPCPFPRGDNNEIAKIHWRNLKVNFSRTTEPISTKLGTMHSWVKGIQICSNEVPALFQVNIITKWQKNFDEIIKSSPEPLGQFQPNLVQSIFG